MYEHQLGLALVLFGEAGEHDGVSTFAHENVFSPMFDNQRHSLTIRVKWELLKDLILFNLASQLVIDFHHSLCAFT